MVKARSKLPREAAHYRAFFDWTGQSLVLKKQILMGFKRSHMTHRNQRDKQDCLVLSSSGRNALPFASGWSSHHAFAVAMRALLVVAIVVFGTMRGAVAQSAATVDGIVHDQSGALISKAKVKLTNSVSGAERVTASNASGIFSIPGLGTGDYVLDVEAPGFESFEIKGIHLDPGDLRTFNAIKLNIISATASVTVTDDVQGLVSTDSGETSTLISSDDIDHMAVEGRDVTELLKILPGMSIVTSGSTFANAAYDPSIVSFGGAIGAYSGNGTQSNSTSILSDGMDITDPGNYGAAIQNVNYDQVAEVKVQTGSFTADTAHGPVVLNAISKSGGNAYHGALYVYGRTNQLNSIDWIAKFAGTTPPNDRQIYPGATIGGPVRIPKTNFNRNNKLTFFVGGEDYTQRKVYAYNSAYAATVSAMVPTANMRLGDFSDTELNAMMGPLRYQTGVDPVTKLPIYGCTGTVYSDFCNKPTMGPAGAGAQGFTDGNIAPYLTYVDPLGEGQKIINRLPLPNVASNGNYNYINTDFVNSDIYQIKSRLDYALSDNTHMFMAYGLESGNQFEPSLTYGRPGPNGMGGGMDTPGNGFTGVWQSHVLSMQMSQVLSASLTNELYAGGAFFSQTYTLRNPSAVEGNPYASQGLLFNNGSLALPSLGTYGASNYDGLPFQTIEDPTYGNDFSHTQLRLGGDNLTKLIQRHTFRAGVFYQWVDHPQMSAGQNTNATLTDYYHEGNFKDTDNSIVYTSGNYIADNLEGIVGGVSQVNKKVETNLYFFTLAGYAQDHWLVSRHMSIDAGVRLEHFTPWLDPHGDGVAVFDPTAYKSGAPLASPGVLYHAIDSAIPLSGVPVEKAWVEPRVGAVYDIHGDSKTILRAGYGIYRQHDSYSDGLLSAQTAEGQRAFSTPTSGHTLWKLNGMQKQVSQAASGFVFDSNINTRWASDYELPEVQTYNFLIDQRLPRNLSFEIAYVGNTSSHLMEANNLRNINAIPFGTLFGPEPNTGRIDDNGANNASLMNDVGKVWPVIGPPNTPNGAGAFLTNGDMDCYRPYPLYNQINAIRHRGWSNYNAMQSRISWTTKHARVNANYTWSKALGAVAGPDPINLKNDYMPLNFDRRHILNFTYSYTEGNLVHERILGWVGNGWEVSGITNFQSGTLINSLMSSNFGVNGTITVPNGTVANAVGFNNTSTCVATIAITNSTTCPVQLQSASILGTPDILLQPTTVADPKGRGNHEYVNGTVFRLPVLGTNGPITYGNLRGPSFFNSDLTARKVFKVSGKQDLQVKMSAFNFLNRANYTFSSLHPGGYSMNFTQNMTGLNFNQDLQSATNQQQGFGSTLIRTGRRVMEVSVRYDF
jgi:hypothetical protein